MFETGAWFQTGMGAALQDRRRPWMGSVERTWMYLKRFLQGGSHTKILEAAE